MSQNFEERIGYALGKSWAENALKSARDRADMTAQEALDYITDTIPKDHESIKDAISVAEALIEQHGTTTQPAPVADQSGHHTALCLV